MIFPKYFEVAFPWINKPKSKIKVKSITTEWLEREILWIIFNQPKEVQNTLDDPRFKLLKSLKSNCCDEQSQVEYIRHVAKCLANMIVKTEIPQNKKEWLGEINKKTKSLLTLLRSIDKKNLPFHWSNLFSLNLELLSVSHQLEAHNKLKLEKAFKEANRNGMISKLDAEKHGVLDLVAILSLLLNQSKDLQGKSANDYYQYPQTFFSEISNDSALYLSYKRSAIQAISQLNQSQYNKPFDALTSYILNCVFNKNISNQSVKNIREKLNSKSM